MQYMVLECHAAYAVVLDEDGSFLKVANRQYEAGQMVTEVIPMQVPPRRKYGKWLTSLAAAAACIALVLGLTLPGQQPYASVYVKINPEVRIDVDKKDMVVGMEGVNQDGIDLISGYDYQKKDLDLVTDDLVDKAIEMGYLLADGQITISLDSQDQVWVEHHTQSISSHLQTHLQEKMVVTIQIGQYHHDEEHDDDDDWDDDDWDDDNGICRDPENPDRIVIQPDWDEDDDEEHHDEDHDDAHDDEDDDDDDD